MKRLSFLFYVLISINLYSQVNETFDDGNFTSNPIWVGNKSLFQVNDNYQLQLNDEIEGSSYLATTSENVGKTEWRCWIKLSFSPSSNNNSRFYLVSNASDLSSDPDGYYLQFGESGSNDAVELFKQKGDEITSVLRSQDGIISSSFELSVKVTRDESGIWKLYLDKTGNTNYLFECEGTDNEIESSNFLGFYCKYTKSNGSGMYFDNVYSGNWQIDEEPPVIEQLSVLNDSAINLIFDEYIDSTSLQIINFNINESVGNPKHIFLDENDFSVIDLIFDNKFIQGSEYELTINNVSDLSGNQINLITLPFVFYEPKVHDIVINEIMADPTPPVALPEYEFVELFNTTDVEIDISGWSITIGSSTKTIENAKIPAGEYLILAKNKAGFFLESYGLFYGFSSFSLTNGGQSVSLINDENIVISQVTYDDTWYNDDEKSDGGWSLEQINHENICSTKENWSSSKSDPGGTPGNENSISSDNIFTPVVEKILLVSNNTIELIFNQDMDETSITNTQNYNTMGDELVASNIYSNISNQVFIVFPENFDTGVIYNLTVKASIKNCNGITSKNDMNLKYGIPEKPNYLDIVINEVLFDPWTNGEEYIEILNVSDKVIDLSKTSYSYVHQTIPNPPDTSSWKIRDEQELFFPGEYYIMTKSPSSVAFQYSTKDEDNFIMIDNMPSLNNKTGHLIISSNKSVIDTFTYSEDLHFELLNYVDGDKKEKITPEISLSTNANWHSASESIGFGTPGCQNSQYNKQDKEDDEISIFPEVFTPNNDGIDDTQSISIGFHTSANTINIKIFNSKGHLVKDLVNNNYSGTQVCYSWDGITDNRMIAPSDIYVYYISIFNTNGNVRQYKKTGILSHRSD